MAKRKTLKNQEKTKKDKVANNTKHKLHPETRKSILLLVFLASFLILILSSFELAGPVGKFIFSVGSYLFGVGYYVVPLTFLIAILGLLLEKEDHLSSFSLVGGLAFIFFVLGGIDIVNPSKGGVVGEIAGLIKYLFGTIGGAIITVTLVIISLIVMINKPLPKFIGRKDRSIGENYEEEIQVAPPQDDLNLIVLGNTQKEKTKVKSTIKEAKADKNKEEISIKTLKTFAKNFKDYTPPPLNLLNTEIEKPTIGDLRANANIIKRTLESFGISVEMGEINVGPTVTRYTLKPAEGIKLSRITALNQDLALALAAHPIRIEAPIPGKSLVGIEVPNKTPALVRLGSLFLYEEFHKSGLLGFALGRNVSGEPVFKDISKMPHLLIAGSTGSGKSIMMHSIILSLLYKNSPETLRLILIDPKRVELSNYENIPHLLAPVITENRKAISVLKWAIQEMDNRYQNLLQSGSRDIKSYNSSNEKKMPYIVIFIDELADLMISYGKEVEGAIIRLAQMARATGIHLVVSTQRPSVEVITGLIKANITSRIAFQVASQVDSRTILDTPGAEKLLGKGDALFISAELSKPLRIQGAFVSEEEIKKVVKFIREHNEQREELNLEEVDKNNHSPEQLFLDLEKLENEDDDELLDEAIKVVTAAKKASASLLQRRLKIGYARAARLLDIMEQKGIVGPQVGAKPREVFYNNEDNNG